MKPSEIRKQIIEVEKRMLVLRSEIAKQEGFQIQITLLSGMARALGSMTFGTLSADKLKIKELERKEKDRGIDKVTQDMINACNGLKIELKAKEQELIGLYEQLDDIMEEK